MKTLYTTILLVIILFSANDAFAQTDGEFQQAVALYRQGDYHGAIIVLERLSKAKDAPDQAGIFNYLGLAYMGKNDLKQARKALDKAIKLSPQNAAIRTNLAMLYLRSGDPDDARREASRVLNAEPTFHAARYVRGAALLRQGKTADAIADADSIISADPNFSSAYLLKSNVMVAEFGKRAGAGERAKDNLAMLTNAIETLEGCVKSCKNNQDLPSLNEEIENLRAFHEFFSREPAPAPALPPAPDPDTIPIKILFKPFARYTDEARSKSVSGRIVLAVLFGADGRVRRVIMLKSLGYGLDEEAINAALQIRFTPLIKNGKAVPTVKPVEYSFSVR